MRDSKTEQMLDSQLVDYVYMDDVAIEQFDEEMSLRNQARIDPPVHPDTVSQYAEAMKNGAEFPALVGYYSEDDKIILIDGNHRLHSYKRAGVKTADVYIVEAAQDVIQGLTYMANASHGRPPSEEERIHHALHLRDLGWGNREAALAVGLTESKVSTAWQLETQKRRARKLNVLKGFDTISKDVRSRLATIQSDNVFKAVVPFLVNTKSLTRIEQNSLIARIKEQTTEETQLQTIVDFKAAKQDEQRTEGRTRHRQDARRGLLPHLGYIVQQDPEAVLNATLTAEQRENLKSQLVKVVSFSNSLMKLIVEAEERLAPSDKKGNS